MTKGELHIKRMLDNAAAAVRLVVEQNGGPVEGVDGESYVLVKRQAFEAAQRLVCGHSQLKFVLRTSISGYQYFCPTCQATICTLERVTE